MSNPSMKVDIDGQTIHMEVVTVDAQLAKEWLGRNRDNRNQSRVNSARITRAMELAEFKFIGDPIRFSQTGRLLDGQHRLKAIVDTGASQTMLIMTGFEDEAQMYMDQGKARQAADQLRIAGVTKSNMNNWAAVARLVIRWDAGDVMGDMLIASNPEVVAFCEEHHDEMAAAIAAAKAQYKRVGARVTAAGAVHFFANRIDHDLCARFFRQLASGEDLSNGNPIFALRDTLLRRKTTDRFRLNEEIVLFVRAWNAARKGEVLTRLQLPREGIKPMNFEMK